MTNVKPRLPTCPRCAGMVTDYDPSDVHCYRCGARFHWPNLRAGTLGSAPGLPSEKKKPGGYARTNW